VLGSATVAQVKGFAAGAVGAPVAGYPCPPYKLLILDEADSMTQVRGAAAGQHLNTAHTAADKTGPRAAP